MDNQSHDLAAPGAKVIRIPSLKRGRDDVPLDDRVKLEKVLGLTVGSNSALDCDPLSEQIAYPAGCTIVLFNSKKNKQSHILNASRKTITCLAFSPGGKYLATGECGHVPSLRVWSVQDGTQIAEFQGHKYGINCVAFSPNNKYVVSIGSQHDMIVNVWDWKSNLKVASNKVSTKVKAISFAENGKYFVTVGMRNVKFWYLDHARSAKYNEPVPLTGRSAILGEQSDNYFCDVACGRGKMGDSTYSITKSGLLCEFSIRRMLDKWVELRTRSANCMSIGENYIFIGCADGIIRCFSPMTLEFLVTLPRPHYLGVDVALGLGLNHLLNPPQDAKYPDAIALTYDDTSKKLTCVYNDHSLYVWSVQEIRRVGKTHSYLFHSACIWGVEVYPEVETQEQLPVPSGSFITCSSDDTIRFWNLDGLGVDSAIYRRNIYSNELLKVIYIDKNLTYLKDLDLTTSSTEKTETSYDGKNGVRSVRISPNGQHLASGDREGNIRIHDLNNLAEMVVIEAHDAEVLCLEYTKESNENLLASASRDRLIHVFDVAKEYECIQTLDDHSSSITSVRFINSRGQLQMISCSADKSIIFRQFHPATPGGTKSFARDHNVAGKTTLYDMEVDCNQKHILTACQDRNIRVYNVNSGKHSKTFKGSMGEDGTLIKVALDNSGIYIATSCTDKSLSIYDYYSGECMATMLGHSELVTGLRFTNDCKRLVSASGDGCIFIWRLPRDMTVTMQARLDQQAVRKGKRTISLQSGFGINDGPKVISDEEPEPFEYDRNANVDKTAFTLNVGQLPAWARREIEDPNKGLKTLLDSSQDQNSPDQSIHTGFSVIKINKPPQGRWAQRIENNEIMIATFSPDKQKPINESNSKDSSLESQMERNNEFVKVQGNEGVEFDGDVEDSDIELETHYYPVSTETNNSEFTVNANDVEELRRSARKYKKQQQLKKLRPNTLNLEAITTTSNPATSVSGSQDSDEDDLEDVSSETETPSIERSLGFAISAVSTESMDLVGQRESYFKNNFESLNTDSSEARKHVSGKSITSQYLVRNTAVITAVKQTKSEIEKMKKREELKKRLEDTRRTLKTSGLSPSPLKASQSICDLSRFPDRGGSASNRNYQSNQGKSNKAVNLLTILSYPTNTKLLKNKNEPHITSESNINESNVSDVHNKAAMFDQIRFKSTSLAYNFRSNFSKILYTDDNKTSLLKNTYEKCGKNEKRNLFYTFDGNNDFDEETTPGEKIVQERVDKSVLKCDENSVNKSDNDQYNSVEKIQNRQGENAKENRKFSFDFLSNLNLTLPDSPVSENGPCFKESDAAKRKRRSCSFYVDFKSAIDKRKKTELNQKEKERLLLAHDQIGYENSNLKISDNRSIENYLEEFENQSDGEFSSDSLESESVGEKAPRRCVSDYQICAPKTTRKICTKSLSLCSPKNTEDNFSDTDFSGLNSLQGSGDLLEMQEKYSDVENIEFDTFGRHSSASFFLNHSTFRSTESIFLEESEYGKLTKNIESNLDFDADNKFRGHQKSNLNDETTRKSDAFYVEFAGSPRKNKPVLRAKTLPAKSTLDKFKLGKDELKGKPLLPPKPVISGAKKKPVESAKKILRNYSQPILPNRVTQDEDLDDEEGLRRAISLSDLSASPTTRSDSNQGKSTVKIGNSQNTFNNSRTTSRDQPMMRCSSVGVLNRMDPNANMHPPDNKKLVLGKGLMRPTISSQNKVTSNKSQITANAKRRPTAVSSVNLANVGVNDDSSSEETGFGRNKFSADKNNANLNQKRQGNLGRYGSLKDLSFKAKEVTQRLAGNTTVNKKNKNLDAEQYAHPDVAAAPLTKQLCSTVTTQVSQDIDNLILLHKRLLIETDNSQNRSQLEQMTEDVEKLAIETQQKLSSLTSKLKNNNSMIRNQLTSNTSNFLGNNLGLMAPNNVSSAPNSFITNASNPNLMTNVDVSRISEMLISVVQQYTENQQNNQKN